MTSRAVLRGRLVTPDEVLPDAVLVVEGGRISWVGPAAQWQHAADWPAPEPVTGTLLPCLVDVHCHGGAGASFPDADVAGGGAAAGHHAAQGTTTLLASLVSAPERELVAALGTCADLADAGTVAGIHLEGPFLSSARRGAHDPRALVAPDLALFDRLLEAGRGHVRSMTYAPELPGAAALASRLLDAGVVPSIGHTDADFPTAATAFRQLAGRSSTTHLFNAMPPIHHRSPGAAAAALAAASQGETVVELVADGVHLADETVATVFDLVGARQIALVSDATAAAGGADGSYRLGPIDVEVVDGVARLANGAIAGGTRRLVDVVRRVVTNAGVSLLDAVTAASATPASLFGLADVTGSLVAGLRADVLVVDDALTPVRVMRAGQRLPLS